MTSEIKNFSPPWIHFAELELGIQESIGPKNNQRILQYHAATDLKATSDSIPWCGSFVSFCIKNAGLSTPLMSSGARNWLRWGVPLIIPAFGCVAVFKRGLDPVDGHVGFWVGEDEKDVFLLGGNQGNKVSVARWPKKDLLGLRWF